MLIIVILLAAFTGYIAGNLMGHQTLRDLEKWRASPPRQRPLWSDR
jgi:hypothetical protein